MIEFLRRLGTLFRRSRVENGLDQEIRFHLEQQTAKNIRAGMSPAQARRAALLRFGGVEQIKEATRDEFRAGWLEDAGRDFRYGARVLLRAPGFAAVSILTLGLGVGAATAVFSVVNGVLLKPLAIRSPTALFGCFKSMATAGACKRRRSRISRIGSTALEVFAPWRKCRPDPRLSLCAASRR
jgi:hypothetical protein